MSNSRLRKRAIIGALQEFNINLSVAERILDIGAGGGTHIYFPPEISSKVTAIDLSEEVLKLNSSKNRIIADARKHFPFPSDYFDIVIQFFLNRYIENQGSEMDEIVRVLKPGGRFIIMDHSKFGHSMEVKQFDPETLKQTKVSSFKDVRVVTLAPAIGEPDSSFYRGPLYLFTGVKPK